MLELKKLTLKNFGPIKDQVNIEFNSGFNLLLAPNGTGKSTTYKAIEMLMLDEYKGSFEDYINWDADKFEASVAFLIDSRPFFIKLVCEKAKTTSTERSLYDNLEGTGNPIASGEEAKQYLAKILDKDVLRYSLIIKQSSEDHIVDCKDSERRDLIQKIKGIDYSDYVEKTIVPKIQKIEIQVAQLDKEIYALNNIDYTPPEKMEQILSEEEYKEKSTYLKNIEIQLQDYDNKKREYQNKVNEKDKLKKDFQTLESSLLTKKTQLVEEKTKLLSFNELPSKYDEEHTLEVERLTREYQIKIQNYEEDSKQSLEKDNNSLNEKKLELDALQQKISSIIIKKIPKYNDEKLQEYLKEKATKESELKRARLDREKIESGICPICHSDCSHTVTEIDKEIQEIVNILFATERNILLAREEKDKYEKEVEDNQKNREEKEKLNSEKEQLLIKIENIQNTILNFNQQKDFWLANQKNFFEKSLSSLETQKNVKLASLKEKIENEKSLITLIEENILSIDNQILEVKTKLLEVSNWLENNPAPQGNENILQEKQTIEPILVNYQKIEAYNKQVIETRERLENQKKENQKLLQEKQAKMKEALEEKLSLESAKSILLKDFPAYIIDQSVSEIEENMNQFIDDVYYKSLCITLRTTKSSLKLEYGRGKNKKPGHQLSGAERKITDIAFKNNYNNLAGISCLLLDEPDSALDMKNKIKLYEALLEMKKQYNQMVVVTHSREMVEYVKNNAECSIIQL